MTDALRGIRAFDFFAVFARGRDFAGDVAEHAGRYRNAEPFPHIVLDGMFDGDVLETAIAEIPSPLASPERLLAPDLAERQERKFAFRDVPELGPASLYLITALSSKPFLEFLTALTGIGGLMPDPYLVGGGFHQIVRGGFLDVHADFNIHPITRAYRRLNLLLYLNPDWNDEWGGGLELWPTDLRSRTATIAPRFNRLVVFSTTETSYHGHPEPLNCPPDVIRRSLALYYYTVERLTEAGHSTLWRRRSPPT